MHYLFLLIILLSCIGCSVENKSYCAKNKNCRTYDIQPEIYNSPDRNMQPEIYTSPDRPKSYKIKFPRTDYERKYHKHNQDFSF